MNRVHPSIPSESFVRRSKHGFFAASTGFVYWWSFSLLSAVNEPWDGLYYWSAAYPVSLLLSAVLGFVFRRDALIIGISFTLAQIPVMVLNATSENSIAMAIFFLSILAVPTSLAAHVGTTLRLRAIQ